MPNKIKQIKGNLVLLYLDHKKLVVASLILGLLSLLFLSYFMIKMTIQNKQVVNVDNVQSNNQKIPGLTRDDVLLMSTEQIQKLQNVTNPDSETMYIQALIFTVNKDKQKALELFKNLEGMNYYNYKTYTEYGLSAINFGETNLGLNVLDKALDAVATEPSLNQQQKDAETDRLQSKIEFVKMDMDQ